MDLAAAIGDQIIEGQRVSALRDVILKNNRKIQRAMVLLQDNAFDLQNIVVKIEEAYLAQQTDALNRSTDEAERFRLTQSVSEQQANLDRLAKVDARVPFRALLVAHKAVARAAQDQNYSFSEAANLLLDFYQKSNALNLAVQKG